MLKEEQPAAEESLLNRGMLSVLVAQFLSALADNALLFIAIALLKSLSYESFYIPALQQMFMIAFVLFAPFVGPVADTLPKGRVMLYGNGLKLLGTLGMFAGLNPLFCYSIVGFGAAIYSPAKYGILRELVGEKSIVKANGAMESSTITAILCGAVLGGFVADYSIQAGFILVTLLYALAGAVNLLIPKLPPAHPLKEVSVTGLVRDFVSVFKRLFSDKDARFCIAGTSLFWGFGGSLRMLIIAWVPVALASESNSTPALLTAVISIGIVIGSLVAGRLIQLNDVNRILPVGIMMGIFVMLQAGMSSLVPTVILLILIGAAGGFFVVPLNALLQERGKQTVGSGHAIAIQNFGQSTAMLVVLFLYSLSLQAGIGIIPIAYGFGLFMTILMALYALMRYRKI